MKTNIKDALQVIAALLLTGSAASAMAVPQTPTTVQAKPTAIVKTVQKTAPTVVAAQPVKTAPVSAPAPTPIVTWQDNPNHCDQNTQYIAATAPFACIDKPQAVSVTNTAPAAPTQATAVIGGCQIYRSGDYYLDKIINYESSGNSCATNAGGCFGLLQACPGAPLRAACGGDPTCQIEWFQQNKTGGRSWAQVWQHELDYGWW